MRLLRFTIGRFVMLLGLRIMPRGRVRKELTILLEHWTEGVHREVFNRQGAKAFD